MQGDPGMYAIKREVERYIYIEKKVLAIPENLPVGPICLKTDPIKDALHGFAMQWKSQWNMCLLTIGSTSEKKILFIETSV
jgi:hypothetical protein